MRRRAWLGLAVAVLAVSWGAPLARLTHAAPLAVAAWRMVLSALLLVPFTLMRDGAPLAQRHRRPASLAGACLGLHFGLWIPSLWLTTVSASVVLVTTMPLWVLLASPRFLATAIRRRNLVSFALAIAGVAVIAWGDVHISLRALLGDAMALGGAVAGAAYFVVGKRLRHEVPLTRYLAWVYTGAALTLAAAVVALGVRPWPEDSRSWWTLLALAVGPTLIGHSLLNWALAHLEAYRVNLSVLLEPVLATLWAWIFIAEAPPLHVLPGAALVIAALAIEMWPDASAATSPGAA